METPNKKIRLTFLFADESALMEDFRKKSSKKMIKWANDFFGKYGFELDVIPDPGTSNILQMKKFCLLKTNGFEPDSNTFDDLQKMIIKEKAPYIRALGRIWDEIDALEIRKRNKKKEIDETRTQLNNLAPDDIVEREKTQKILIDFYEEHKQIIDAIDSKRQENKEINAALDSIDEKYIKEKENLDFTIEARLQIGQKILETIPMTGLKSMYEHLAINDNARLKIVFCRFRLSPFVLNLKMRVPDQPSGATISKNGATKLSINFNTYNRQYLWDGPFILINVSRYDDITLAHELVHAAGRSHIPPKKELKKFHEWSRDWSLDPKSGEIEMGNSYNYVSGGYYDGAPNDIINYNSKGKKPSEVILTDKDKKNFEDVFFVRDTPNP